MSEQHLTEREEIEILLPWYEKGTLSLDEMQRVERYLANDAELAAQLPLIREEIPETMLANEAHGFPSSAARDRLMAEIATQAKQTPAQGRGFGQWLSSLLPGSLTPGMSLAGAAAAIVIVIQAVALISVMNSDGEGNYEVASGGKEAGAAHGTFILIRFNKSANAEEIAALLRKIEATIVDGPKPGGAYKLRLSKQVLPDERKEALIEQLRANRDVVAFAASSR